MGAFSTDKRGEKKMFENLQSIGVSEMMLWIAVASGSAWIVFYSIGQFLHVVFGWRSGVSTGLGFVLILALIPALVFSVTLAYWKAQSIAISFEGVGAATEEPQPSRAEPTPEDNSWLDPSGESPLIKKPKFTDL